MKIILCTTPIRPVPTDYPPFGSLALIQALRRAGYDPHFYDIDGLRPAFEEVVRFFQESRPDLIAISAVVSTAYAYTKKLCLELKRILPEVPIVLGGNLAASAELLHRHCHVDVCVAGEGEIPLTNLVKHFEAGGGMNPEALRKIPGLTFLNEKEEMEFTGFELPIAPEDFADPDFGILEKYSRISNFITDPFSRPDFARDPRSHEPHRRGQKLSQVLATKGCVARCTFCHRWDKGFRHFPPADIVRRIQYLKDKYNVGYFQFGDENFGSDRKSLDELIRLIAPLDILYMVSGVRVRSVDPELLVRMRDSGCVALYYGMETGSPRILKVMEKNAELEHNIRAALWTNEAGIYTIYQLVLAMPGETSETVNETLDFIKKVTEGREEPPHKVVSTNYIQALPGTAVYEYARHRGLIADSLKGEEDYLMKISDVDANDDMRFINFTEEDYLTVQTWRIKILFEAEAHWYRLRGWKASTYRPPAGAAIEARDYYTQGGYFNIKKMLHNPLFYRYGWHFRHVYYVARALTRGITRLPARVFWRAVADYFLLKIFRVVGLRDYRSLRRIVKENNAPPATLTQKNMTSLREGR